MSNSVIEAASVIMPLVTAFMAEAERTKAAETAARDTERDEEPKDQHDNGGLNEI